MVESVTEAKCVPDLAGAARVRRIAAGAASTVELIERMIRLCRAGLPQMYRPDERIFAFTRKGRPANSLRLKGRSFRYSAIVALGAGLLDAESQRSILGGETAGEFCGRLIRHLPEVANLGDTALASWAAAEMEHPDLGRAIDRLRQLSVQHADCSTVEAAWVLTALASVRHGRDLAQDAAQARDRLLRACSKHSGIFRHATDPSLLPRHRAHVGCFADQVYPIQALARYSHALEDPESLDIAARCAQAICRLQGNDGQWWWHYDARTGQVVEGYPVYTVHQDSMAPMALMDLCEAGGPDCGEAIRLGLSWMARATEVDRCLIDDRLGVIWRSVKRNDPAKGLRMLRAVVSGAMPSVRVRLLDAVFPPRVIDYEDRPYHLGWILHAWLGHL